MFLKIAKMVESYIQQFAGGLGPLERPGKVSRSCMQRMDGNTFIFQQQALKS